MNTELKDLLAKLDAARSQIEDLNDDLRMLWEADAFDFEDSMWHLQDCCALIETAIDLHK